MRRDKETNFTIKFSNVSLELDGLVHSYLAFSKTKEALYAATEAMAMPQSQSAKALFALAELHVFEGQNGDAVSLLERYLKDWVDDSLHVKLAQVFAATNMLQDALSHYQAALRLVRSATGSAMFSTLEDGKIVEGLAGVPNEGRRIQVILA
ncbi:anaphase-promoting complex subunit 7-like isoform X2 [Alnus glutinosa]|uniref:anaphase-promoting complex subunit 7-like isoform X2 n=1 Tax=Alnus glutinosa TaxID=3517 RepID=UPI002D77FEF8|nr:anaphase-promoting complex subunit 7-like isoform X2 [Alnus glutinosa]